MIHSTYIVEEIRQSIENDDKLIVRNMPQFYFYPSRRIAMILCCCNKKKLRQTIYCYRNHTWKFIFGFVINITVLLMKKIHYKTPRKKTQNSKVSDKYFSSIHQSGILIFREKSVFSSFQSSKQPIRFLKISLTSRFCLG